MKKLKVEAALMILLAVGIFAVLFYEGSEQRENINSKYTATFLDVFDTKTEMIGYAESEEAFMRQAELLKEKLLYYHQLYDIYNSYEELNNLKTINENAGITSIKVEREIIELLKLSKEMYEQTNGKVNVAMGSVLSIWHDYREHGVTDPENASLPEMKELKEASEYTDMNHVIIDEDASTVYLEMPQMSLDVGSIGKGYAVQKTAEYARELGMENLLLSVGGNVCAIGPKMDGSKWTVGIQNPDFEDTKQYAGKVTVENCSVVTSGNYQRYYTVDGKRYCHIINPDTLMPSEYFASVSIIARDSGVADALSTAIYNMPLEEGLSYVNMLENVEAMWILENGDIVYSEDFEKYLTD